jgi:hypothetical protein
MRNEPKQTKEAALKQKQSYVPPTLSSKKVFLPMMAQTTGGGTGAFNFRKPFPPK